MGFPSIRLRRPRQNPLIRRALQETDLSPRRLIVPLFIRPGKNVSRPIPSMPGQAQWSVDRALLKAKAVLRNGFSSVLLFGVPSRKDAQGSEAWAPHGLIQQATRQIKKALPGLVVITDLCFCEYTSHGHCGIIRGGRLDNDATLKNIAKTAVAQARAGSDIIAPSGMVDGMVRTIRQALDESGFQKTLIMSYAAKYASAFYGPFREAAECAPKKGDRRGYQMDPSNAEEALREVELDILEGADIVMVKPALAYLDIIRRVKDKFGIPVAAYNVSGEYSMVKAATANGWLDEKKTVREILTGIRRAGADLIITYHANDL